MKKIYCVFFLVLIHNLLLASPTSVAINLSKTKIIGDWTATEIEKIRVKISPNGFFEYFSQLKRHDLKNNMSCSLEASGFIRNVKFESEDDISIQVEFTSFTFEDFNLDTKCPDSPVKNGMIYYFKFRINNDKNSLFLRRKRKDVELIPSDESNIDKHFIKDSLYWIRNDLRASIFIADYYKACLRGNTNWFAKYGKGTKSKMFCKVALKPIKNAIRERYSLMKALLSLGQYVSLRAGDAGPPRLKWNGNILNNEEISDYVDHAFQEHKSWDLNQIVNWGYVAVNVHHEFPGMIDLPEVTTDEQRLAAKIQITDLIGRKIWTEQGNDSFLKNTYCAKDSRIPYFHPADDCYLEEAKKLIMGDSEKKIGPLPLLGYVTSPEPNNHELISGIVKIQNNAKQILKAFEDEYFYISRNSIKLKPRNFSIDNNLELFTFAGALSRLVNEKPVYHRAFNQGKEKLKAKETRTLYMQIGGIIGWSIGCSVLARGVLAKGLCELPVGIGANLYFYVIDSSKYSEAIKIAMYRPDGSRVSGKELSELNDLDFAKNISAIMLPFFTGVPKVIKALRPITL